MRTLWTLHRDDAQIQALAHDLGVNGVEVVILEAGRARTVRERFATWALATQWADNERARLLREGWVEASG